MKKYLLLFSCAIAVIDLAAHASGNTVELRVVNMTDSALALNSRMKDGKFITALSVTEVKVFTKRCLADPVEITLNVSPQEVKEVLWCRWDPVKQSWELLHKPKPVKDENGHYILREQVTCPGYYGYFTRPQGIPKGVKIKVPARYRIDWLRIEQEYPMAFRDVLKMKAPERECALTVGDIRFDTCISLQVRDRHGKTVRLSRLLAGRYLDFMDEPDADGYRLLSVPEDAFELPIEPLTIKTN